MKKRLITALLSLVLLTSLAVPFASASAVQTMGWKSGLELNYYGNTAKCSISICSISSNIKITMTLFQRNRLIATWTKEGKDCLTMDESCNVAKGYSYTLRANVLIDGVAQVIPPVTKSNN